MITTGTNHWHEFEAKTEPPDTQPGNTLKVGANVCCVTDPLMWGRVTKAPDAGGMVTVDWLEEPAALPKEFRYTYKVEKRGPPPPKECHRSTLLAFRGVCDNKYERLVQEYIAREATTTRAKANSCMTCPERHGGTCRCDS